MKKDLFTIVHAEFGTEEFQIKDAKYNVYKAEDDIWELTLSFETSAAIKRADKLQEIINAKPNFEATAILPSDDIDLRKGRIIYQEEGYDEQREEVLSNIYYFQHESIEELRIEIIDLKENEILINLTAKGIVNGSRGNQPDAEFILKEVSFKHDKNLFRNVM